MYLRAIFQVKAPEGAHIWRGDLTEGFLHYQFGGFYLEGLIHGGIYFWNFTVLRIDRKGMIDDVMTCSKCAKTLVDSDRHEFAKKQNARKRCCWRCNTTWLVYFPRITLLLILQWHTGVYEEMFIVDIKIAWTMQKVKILPLESQVYWRNGKLQQLSQRFHTLTLETRRYGPKSGVSHIIQWSWQNYQWHLVSNFCSQATRKPYFFS